MRSRALYLLVAGLLALGATRAGAQEDHEDQAAGRHGEKRSRFAVELYGGWASVAPSDLNLLVEYDERVRLHQFDAQLEALLSSGEIVSWDATHSAQLNTIDDAWSGGLRVKYRLNERLAFSLGLQGLRAGGSDNPRFRYTRLDQWGDERIEELSYSPYRLSVEAYAPLLGVHLGKRLKKKLELEGFLLAGPLFAEIEYVSDWQYTFSMQGPSMTGLVFQTDGRIEGQGEGTGVAADLGLRLQYAAARRIAVFVEGSYAYQRVGSLSGSGSEDLGNEREAWNGEWAIARDSISSPWGTVELELPTNYWPEGSPADRLRDFELDCSGFQLRMGLSFGIR